MANTRSARSSWVTFIAIVSALIFLIIYYVGSRLTETLPDGSKFQILIWAALSIWGVSLISSRLMGRFFGTQFASSVMWANYGLMGFLVILVSLLILTDFFKLGVWILFPQAALVFTLAPWIAFSISVLLSGFGFLQAVKAPQVFRVKVPIANLHPSLEGFKIVQISDLHIGSTINKAFAEKVTSMATALKPDLIALTGDIVDGTLDDLKDSVSPLQNLKSTHGVFYITGNHEYFWGASSWIDHFKQIGFHVLVNENKIVSHQGANLKVIGLPDLMAARFFESHKIDMQKASAGPTSDFTLLLAHQPKSYLFAETIDCQLQLSGHTHSGQFFPANLLIRFFHKYYRGLNNHQDKFYVYVNQGTGYWGPPNRLGVPSEISLLELTKDLS